MRITGTLFILFITLISCSKETKSPTQDEINSERNKTQNIEKEKNATSSKHEGLTLIEGSDCLTCHQDQKSLVGPSYKDIAAKYTEKDIDLLADRIINGSVGNWGNVPMAPHSGLTKDNAKKMVEYILTLKK